MLKKLSSGIGVVASLLVASGMSFASTTTADVINLGSLSGKSTNDGIQLTSFVYFQSGSSLTLQGSGGTVTVGSSVTASSFFGDGSVLSGVVPLASTQTFSAAQIFESSLTVQSNGNEIILSTSSQVSNLKIDSSGDLSFYPELHNSSATTVPQYTTTSQYLGTCVPGSTVTITTGGGSVELVFLGYLSGVSQTPGLSFLEDGAFTLDLSSTTSARYTGVFANTTFRYLIKAPSASEHSFCLTIAALSSAPGSVTLNNDSSNGNLFFVKELK